jgi:ORF6N domain
MPAVTELSPETILPSVALIRGVKVLLDADLAALYEVETKRLNQAVKCNMTRFPEDFMFQLDPQEFDNLRSQIDLKLGRATNPTVYVHRTGRGDAQLGTNQRSGD